jgi:AmiR/NasT family two-component response regulator
MSRPSSFSLRGRKALVAIKDERDATIVRRQFERLGLEGVAWTPAEPVDFAPDLSLIDDEFLPLLQPAQRAFLTRSPVIALVGTETPSRLKLVFELDPASFLIKPLRSAGIYAALVMAFERNERTSELKQRIFKLEQRLRSRRVVLAAVLQVMHSHALAEPASFALIRRTAMEQRKTIEELSAEITARGMLPRATGKIASCWERSRDGRIEITDAQVGPSAFRGGVRSSLRSHGGLPPGQHEGPGRLQALFRWQRGAAAQCVANDIEQKWENAGYVGRLEEAVLSGGLRDAFGLWRDEESTSQCRERARHPAVRDTV